jgi:hypothetical protein
MSGGAYGANYRPERNIFFMNFRLSIDPRGLGVVRNKMLLDVRVEGGGFNSFGDQACNGVNRFFGKRFVSEGREEVKKFGIIVDGVHDDSHIAFIIFEDDDVGISVEAADNKQFLFG